MMLKRNFRDHQDRDKDQKCYYCHEVRHIRYNCPKLKAKKAITASVTSEDLEEYRDALMVTSCLEKAQVV